MFTLTTRGTFIIIFVLAGEMFLYHKKSLLVDTPFLLIIYGKEDNGTSKKEGILYSFVDDSTKTISDKRKECFYFLVGVYIYAFI